MPERDRFERKLGPGWQRAYRLVKGAVAPNAEVADALARALADTLRNGGGVPGLEEMCVVVRRAEEDTLESFVQLEHIVQEHDGHRHTTIAAGVAKSLLVQTPPVASGTAQESVVDILARDTCAALVDHSFFSKVRPRLLAEGRFSNHEQARQWQAQVEYSMQSAVAVLATQIARRPDAAGLRAPNRSVPKQSTKDLLAENLLSAGSSEPLGR